MLIIAPFLINTNMDYFEQYANEHSAATHLRDDLSYLIGRLTNVEEVEAEPVKKAIEEALAKHDRARTSS